MIRSGKIWGLVCAAAALPVFVAGMAQADPISYLHMDINSVTISAYDATGTSPVAFSGSLFTGELKFATNNLTVMGMDIDGNTNINYTGDITGMTGTVDLTDGSLSGGTVTVDVQTGGITDSYTYDIVINSGSVYRPTSDFLFSCLGYSLEGGTDNGTFGNNAGDNAGDFAGVDVSPWVTDEPLSGAFWQFHYRPDATTGVDTTADIDLYVDAIGSSGAPTVPLPSSLLGGLAGIGGLGVYRWRRARRIDQDR